MPRGLDSQDVGAGHRKVFVQSSKFQQFHQEQARLGVEEKLRYFSAQEQVQLLKV
jgi:hypothetical protein